MPLGALLCQTFWNTTVSFKLMNLLGRAERIWIGDGALGCTGRLDAASTVTAMRAPASFSGAGL